jgi:hypothetical protein
MKHHNTHFLQLSRKIFTSEYSNLSNGAKWLFVVLNELEQKYTGEKEDFFFRTNEDLVNDTGFGITKLKLVKAELVKTDLIKTWRMHFIDKATGRRSEKTVTAYKIIY